MVDMMRFSKHHSKLDNAIFTSIRKNTGFYTKDKVISITTPKTKFKAKVMHTTPITKADIDESLARADADCSREELIEMLEKWYGKKFDDFALIFLLRV